MKMVIKVYLKSFVLKIQKKCSQLKNTTLCLQENETKQCVLDYTLHNFLQLICIILSRKRTLPVRLFFRTLVSQIQRHKRYLTFISNVKTNLSLFII